LEAAVLAFFLFLICMGITILRRGAGTGAEDTL
jgi:hypothetical protein